MSPAQRIAIVGYDTHAMTSRIALRLRRRGHEVDVISPDAMVLEASSNGLTVHPFDENLPDALVLTVSTDQIAAVQSAAVVEAMGVPVINRPSAVLTGADKAATATVLVRAGLPVPRSIAVCSERAAHDEATRLGYPLVLKAADGSEGNQVELVREASELMPAIARIRLSLGHDPSVRSMLVLQEVVAASLGRDRRTFVVGGRVQACMDRVARPGEWRSNMSQGATPFPAVLTAEEERIAVDAAAALGLDFCTVDLMSSESGPVVIEANPFGDVLDVAVASGVDVIASLVELVEQRAAGRTDVVEPVALSTEDRDQLAAFCWDRLSRKIEELEPAAGAPAAAGKG